MDNYYVFGKIQKNLKKAGKLGLQETVQRYPGS
jgi:hypothetical protein